MKKAQEVEGTGQIDCKLWCSITGVGADILGMNKEYALNGLWDNIPSFMDAISFTNVDKHFSISEMKYIQRKMNEKNMVTFESAKKEEKTEIVALFDENKKLIRDVDLSKRQLNDERFWDGLENEVAFNIVITDDERGSLLRGGEHFEFRPLSELFLDKREREIDDTTESLESAGDFKIENEEEGKKFVNRSVALRRGQGKFRKELLKAYDGKCAITSCSTISVLEAAHIVPYNGEHTNHVQNGLLLRSDIHTLFDLNLLRVGEDYAIYVHEEIAEPEYRELHGNVLNIPKKKSLRPSKKYLAARAEPSTREDEEE
tara:strand:+ start:70 stop:1017 length:948 start_codon:yes stop_codon:yes gene_type:complete